MARCSNRLYVSPDCESLPQAFTMEAIVCLWENGHAHFFLLEILCLVWGRLALPVVRGRFVFYIHSHRIIGICTHNI